MHSPEDIPVKPNADSAIHWHALLMRHQHERKGARYLSDCGHQVFLPLYSALHRWNDRNKQVWLPLFPGYLFIQGGLHQRLQVLNAPGVCKVVGWSGRPAIIPPEQIAAVRNLVDSSFPIEPHEYLRRGERVRVCEGALRGLEGILVRNKNKFRVVVCVDLLGRSAAVEIDSNSLERAHHTKSSPTIDQ